MKKFVILTVMLFCFISLVGCGANAKIIQQNDSWLIKSMNDIEDGTYKMNTTQSVPFFEISPEDFVKLVNEEAVRRGYEPIVEANPETKYGVYQYAFNNGEKFLDIFANTDRTGIRSIKMNTFAHTEEEAARNGAYTYILIDLFHPGKVERIADEIYVYGELPNGVPESREIQCGNVTYIAQGYGEFEIKPNDN